MLNPILQALNGQNPSPRTNNSILGRLSEIRQVMAGQPVQVVYNRLLQTNPQFAQFVRQNQGKSIEQLAAEFGINPADLQALFR